MPKRKPPTRPLPNPRTAQSPDAAALAKRLMSPAGLLNPLVAMGASNIDRRPPQRNNKRGRR